MTSQHVSFNAARSLRLVRRTPHSFDCLGSIPELANWLLANQFTEIEKRSITEFGRYLRSGRIVILYHSSAVVATGKSPAACIALLSQLVDASEVR